MGKLLVSRGKMEWDSHPKNLLTHTLWNVGKCPFSNEMEVILIVDLLTENEGDPTICFD